MDWFLDSFSSFMGFVANYRLPYINLTMIDIAIIFLLVGLAVQLFFGGDNND